MEFVNNNEEELLPFEGEERHSTTDIPPLTHFPRVR